MNSIVTTFTNPFSFFCKVEDDDNPEFSLHDSDGDVHSTYSNINISDMNHGQYVAVMCNNKWRRGIVSMESQFLIWLVDYGVYVRPNDRTVRIDLPPEYKKVATKVFEASIHGVVPMDKVLTDDCQIRNEKATTWNKGAVEKAQSLIKSAQRTVFVPVALMTTPTNDIVIGDLFLNLPGKGFVNIIDELEKWPVFLEKNKHAYIQDLPMQYPTRRKHRACVLKPDFPELPAMNLQTTFDEYNSICENIPHLEPTLDYCSEVGSTVVTKNVKKNKDQSEYTLTPSEIEEYSEIICNIDGREYNFLNTLVNKMNDIKMCMQYKNHDLKSVGRANVHRVKAHNLHFDG